LSPRVKKFKSFEHAPSVPSHNESSDYEASSILSLLTLDEDTLMVFEGFIHEIENLVRDLFLLVK
jgi:hypothetical protein